MTNIGMKDLGHKTVNGPIKKSELGFTLMHEHIFVIYENQKNVILC